MTNAKYRDEINDYIALCARKNQNQNQELADMLEQKNDENWRLHDELATIRAMVATMYERQTSASADSGLGSANNSDDGASYFATQELDEQISNERLLRQYRSTLE